MAAASSFAIAGLVTAVISTAASVGMTIYSSDQQTKFQSKVAEQNAQKDAINAVMAQREAQAAANRERKSSARKLARLRAIQGSRGVVGEGSPLEQLADAAGQYEMEAMDIERQGELAARGYLNRANESRTYGQNIKKAQPTMAASTALRGAAQVGGALSNYAAIEGGL